ncbi:hypothetical protein GGX14DRAFT_573304 [Mycena pura]|uniref:Uncharacterized protein n=1 Tax=Mycena pura TaxID=153505 RepID=A0AAD6V3Z3_9AGAR|nr:hypothetical protein GGX14DRAFT_573304 [Mycena pura]
MAPCFRPIPAAEQQARAEAPLPDVQLLPEIAFKRISAGAEEEQERMFKRWVAYVGKLSPTTEPVPATVLDQLTSPPSRKHLFGFVGYLAKTTTGKLDEWPTRGTIQGYMWSFYGMWHRRTGKPIPAEDKHQATQWLGDPRFLSEHPLSTKMRDKPVASHADIRVLTAVLWRDSQLILLPHERAQLIYGVLLMAISSARPGEIVVSSKHHLGQCLTWKDHRLFMCPSENPFRPDIYAHVTMEWLKGMRDDESKYRSLVLKCDPLNLANCPVFALVCCAIADGVMLDYDTGASLLQPTHPVTEMREIRLDPAKAKLALLRKVRSTNGRPVMTTEPMTTSRFRYVVKEGSLKAGFKRHMPLYASRRNVAGKADSQASEAIRRLCMAHSAHSKVYESSYQSKLVPLDMQHLVSGEGEADVRRTLLATTTTCASDRRPKNFLGLGHRRA